MTLSPDTLTPEHPRIEPRRALTLPFGLSWSLLALLAILLVVAALRLVDAASIGDGNTYYTAAIRNMLRSPYNFFFITADAGNVTVDKPPVGLWVQALFGLVFGVTGFVLTLPSILAGVLSVAVLYHLVQRSFGKVAGLLAAFVLAAMPVSVAVDRTNNLDSMLILVLLLATWAFIRATETGKWRDLLLGAVLIGVGFNIKMLQAYLILPALYGLYLFGASVRWRRKVVQLVVATALLLVVSLSWVVVVDLTPADQRPYIGGSQTNSVLELALGYNGLQRLTGAQGSNGPIGQQPDGSRGVQPISPLSSEVGEPGALRLFTQPLVNELSWLLPFGLFSIALVAVGRRVRLPVAPEHRTVILWGGWLVIGVVYFSVSRFFHAYYLATIAPALAALVGIGVARLWALWHSRRWLATIATLIAVGSTLGLQLLTVRSLEIPFDWQTVLIVLAVAVGTLSAVISLLRTERRWRVALLAALVAAMFLTPTYMGIATATSGQVSAVLPGAYSGAKSSTSAPSGAQAMPLPPGTAGGNMPAVGNINMGELLKPLVEYLKANDTGETYQVAVPSAMVGSSLVIDSDLRVMYLAGFNAQDSIHTADSLAALIKAGRLRFVAMLNTIAGAGGPMGGDSLRGLNRWVTQHCKAVEDLEMSGPMLIGGPMGSPGTPGGSGGANGLTQPPAGFTLPAGMFQSTQLLYDCAAAK